MAIVAGAQALASDVLALHASGPPKNIKPALVRWVVPGWYVGYFSDIIAATATRIYYIPIFVEEDTTYIRIGAYLVAASAGGSTADIRIFAWANGVPGALVLNCGTIPTDGAPGVLEIVIAQLLTRGYYFLAIRCSHTPTFRNFDRAESAPPVGGTYTGLGGLTQVIMTVDAAYADPGSAPTAVGYADYCPIVMLREN